MEIFHTKEKAKGPSSGGWQAERFHTGFVFSSNTTISSGSRVILKGCLELQIARATKERKSPREQAMFGSVPKPSHRQLANFGSSCLSCKHQPCEGLCSNPKICQRQHLISASQIEGKRDPQDQTRLLGKPLCGESLRLQAPVRQPAGCLKVGAFCLMIMGCWRVPNAERAWQHLAPLTQI